MDTTHHGVHSVLSLITFHFHVYSQDASVMSEKFPFRFIMCLLITLNYLHIWTSSSPQSSQSPAPCPVGSSQKERFLRRHSVNVPPLPLVPEEPPAGRAAKRVTVDFSVLTVPLGEAPQDGDSEADRAAAAGENETLQVLSFV